MSNLTIERPSTLSLCHQDKGFIGQATRPNTRKAYQADIRHFIQSGGLLPTTPEHVIHYLEAQATLLNPRTLIRRLTALKQWHVYQHYPDPTTHPYVRKTLKGIQNTLGRPKVKARVIALDELTKIITHLSQSPRLIHMRDSALLLMGFFGAFRRSELVSIEKEHIRELAEGVEILIPRSKTDGIGEGQVCAIPYGNHLLCPVTALLTWCEVARIQTGPVFKQLSKSGRLLDKAIGPGHVGVMLKQRARSAGLSEAEQISSHSLRRSFATLASQKGASFSAIMRQGRWRHERTVLGYIESGQAFEDNAAKVILTANEQVTGVD